MYKSICDESNSVDPQTIVQWKGQSLSQHTDEYAPKDIYNLDETGLFSISFLCRLQANLAMRESIPIV